VTKVQLRARIPPDAAGRRSGVTSHTAALAYPRPTRPASRHNKGGGGAGQALRAIRTVTGIRALPAFVEREHPRAPARLEQRPATDLDTRVREVLEVRLLLVLEDYEPVG
jgi:hypothetical protein